MSAVRVVLPAHLRTLASAPREVRVEVPPDRTVTQRTLLDALEERYPTLRGTIRFHDTKRRRPFVRFFAEEEDLSHEDPDAALPNAVVEGREPYVILGAIAGG